MPLLECVLNLVQSPTELKVRQVTDEDEETGAMGTLMHEISALTYGTKTLQEITQLLIRRLTGYGKTVSHQNSICILRTLTLVLYLINNGSDQFVAWMTGNLDACECLRNLEARRASDEPLVKQIRSMAEHICHYVRDDEFLEQRRRDVIEFRSSISSPGRKSTDNSHLRRIGGARGSLERQTFSSSRMHADLTAAAVHEYGYAADRTSNGYKSGMTDLNLKRRNVRMEVLGEEEEARLLVADMVS